MTSITNLNAPVTPADYVAQKRNALLTGIAFAQVAAKDAFFTPNGTAPTSITAQRAEAMWNDVDSKVYYSPVFASVIEAQTGEKVRDFTPSLFIPKLGMVLRAVKPQYRDRTDDGYEVGKIYLVTNESTGRARGYNNTSGEYKNSKNGYGAAQPMSRINDEWELVTDHAEIEKLVDHLLETLDIKLVDALLSEDGPSFLPLLDKISR